MPGMSENNLGHYIEQWKPTENIAIVFDDHSGEERAMEQIDKMFEEFRAVANKYDFDLLQWGNECRINKMESKK